MAALFGQMLTTFCSATLTLLLFVLTLFAQNIPAISNILSRIWTAFLQASYLAYSFLLERIPLLAGIKGPVGAWRVVATFMLSLGIYLGICYAFGYVVRVWMAAISAAHGLYIGLTWDHLSEPNGLDMGKRIQ